MIKEGTVTSESVTAIDAPAASAAYPREPRRYSSDGYDEKHKTGLQHSTPPSKSFFATPESHLTDRPFFITIGESGLIGALQKLDEQLKQSGRSHILSRKRPTDWIGREVTPGKWPDQPWWFAQYPHSPWRYPGMPLRNWWARDWCGTKGLSDTVVSQNQVSGVVSDPQNHIFGAYRVLAIVDQTHLPTVIKDDVTKPSSDGQMHEVTMKSSLRDGAQRDYVMALFLNIPANNCAILQKGDDLEQLSAGQHYITNPNVTLRGLFTLGENQIEMPTKDIFTRDQVPVALTIYLKWQLTEPLKLTMHGYNTPYDALRDKCQSILTQIVAHPLAGPRQPGRRTDPNGAFLDALRTRAMDDLHFAALEYGIVMKDLGEIASTMDRLTTRALQAQVEAANVDRENSNRIKQEEGALQSDSQAYSVVAAAKAEAQKVQIEAEAQAQATRLAAEAEAAAIRIRAAADADMEMRRVEVSRVQAFGSKTVFVPTDGIGAQMGSALATGLAAGMGADARK
ncbi:uncharacterized protein B0H18DRAFT_985041 [Fomitopsis serialis]|uniref:uncharacterized protein n=1 Tax=Fomitopsis serialis TaxID=139415 RepID=UPI00200882EE|nr:uncharacterized protein B0H18DRAFT_985041 [Neoantrodia serialis]KAH9932996.1 hypothetical protein B0H18DRAFT_985041 [Neoantrodia serialis]